MNRPPIEHYLDESADIESTADGFALITPLVRVNLSPTLAGRLAINISATERRTNKAAS